MNQNDTNSANTSTDVSATVTNASSNSVSRRGDSSPPIRCEHIATEITTTVMVGMIGMDITELMVVK